ncbi:MAG TPA: hypothetical protein VGG49_00230, partial [Steroidobacteraceae bacterium]
MCATCGCSAAAPARFTDLSEAAFQPIAEQGHIHSHSVSVKLEQDVLARNNLLAKRNRDWLRRRSTLA